MKVLVLSHGYGYGMEVIEIGATEEAKHCAALPDLDGFATRLLLSTRPRNHSTFTSFLPLKKV